MTVKNISELEQLQEIVQKLTEENEKLIKEKERIAQEYEWLERKVNLETRAKADLDNLYAHKIYSKAKNHMRISLASLGIIFSIAGLLGYDNIMKDFKSKIEERVNNINVKDMVASMVESEIQEVKKEQLELQKEQLEVQKQVQEVEENIRQNR